MHQQFITWPAETWTGKQHAASFGTGRGKSHACACIQDEKLRVGKANADGLKDNKKLTDIDPSFAGKAPLWFYVLAEAQQAFKNNDTPIRLGPVGGRLVGEVFFGLLIGDSHSYLSQDPHWHPEDKFLRNGEFHFTELISQAKEA